MNLTLAEMQAAMGATGDLDGREALVPCRVQTDSRIVGRGEVFVCIAGERFDGHCFAADAVRRGAVAVVAERPLGPEDGVGPKGLGAPLLMVADSVAALGLLGALWRSRARAKVAGVTGSAGKTTVKELLAHLLASVGTVHKNAGNLNNQIGLPASMLAARGDEDFWVLEAGISEPRDMDELGAILRPDVAVIVNVGPAHLQGLGDLRSVAGYKSRLLAHMQPGGRGVASADYPELASAVNELRRTRGLEVATFSCRGNDAPYQGRCLEMNGEGALLALDLAGEEICASVPLPGAAGAENATAAAAAAHVLGLSPAQIATGFAGFVPPEQRMRRRRLGGWLLIDDSYNANPLSMAASLEVAGNMARGSALILALGEMRELGAASASEHEALGRAAADLGAAAVFWRGGRGDDVARGLRAGQFNGTFAVVAGVEDFVALWRTLAVPGGVVLFKGSRANRMEELHQALSRELHG